jgi:hypothetical protein
MSTNKSPPPPEKPELLSEETLANTALGQLLLSGVDHQHHAAQLLLALPEEHREAIGMLEQIAPHAQPLIELAKHLLTPTTATPSAEPAPTAPTVQVPQPQRPAPPPPRRVSLPLPNENFVDFVGRTQPWLDPSHREHRPRQWMGAIAGRAEAAGREGGREHSAGARQPWHRRMVAIAFDLEAPANPGELSFGRAALDFWAPRRHLVRRPSRLERNLANVECHQAGASQ